MTWTEISHCRVTSWKKPTFINLVSYSKTHTLTKWSELHCSPCTQRTEGQIVPRQSEATVCIREGRWSLCAASIKAGTSSRLCLQRSKWWSLGDANSWEQSAGKTSKQSKPCPPCHHHVSQNCCPAKQKAREMTQCFLKSCHRSPEAQHSSACWEYRSSDGTPATGVCLFCPSAYRYSDKTTSDKLTKTLELNRVVVCALLAVALITWLRVQTEAILTDLLSKELAFISIWGENVNSCVTITIRRLCRGARRNKTYVSVQATFALNRGPQGAQTATGKKQLVGRRLQCARSQNGKGKWIDCDAPSPLSE